MAPVAVASRPFYLVDGPDIYGYGVRFPDGSIAICWDQPIGTNSKYSNYDTIDGLGKHDRERLHWGAPGLVVIEEDGLRDVVLRTLFENCDDRLADNLANSIMAAVHRAMRMGGEQPDGQIDGP